MMVAAASRRDRRCNDQYLLSSLMFLLCVIEDQLPTLLEKGFAETKAAGSSHESH